MIIDTNSVKPGHSVVYQSISMDAFLDSLPPLEKKVSCTAEIDRMSTAIFVQLHFEGVFTLSCARCLEEYSQSVTGDCRVILEERSGVSGAAREDDTADFYFNDDAMLVDISPYIFDEIMTSIPLMPLCGTECRGVERAESKAEQVQETYDPRWDALKKLKK